MALRPDNEKTKHNIMVKRFLIQTAPGIVAAVFGLALPLSCVNEEYDISKVDTTVSLGGNALVFPLGATEQLKLNTLLSEEDFEYITSLDGGVYAFTVSDEMDLSDDIPDVISEFKVDPITIDLSVEAVAGSKARDTESVLSDAVSDISAVSPRVIRFERTFEKQQEITIMDLEELPEELKDMTVEDVVLSETELHMTFIVRTVPDIGSTPHIDLSVYLPEEIMTDDERVDENNVFRISEDLEKNEFTMEPIAVTGLNLKNVDFSAGGTVKSSVRVEGTVTVENPVIDDPADLETVVIWLDITGGIPAVKHEPEHISRRTSGFRERRGLYPRFRESAYKADRQFESADASKRRAEDHTCFRKRCRRGFRTDDSPLDTSFRCFRKGAVILDRQRQDRNA